MLLVELGVAIARRQSLVLAVLLSLLVFAGWLESLRRPVELAEGFGMRQELGWGQRGADVRRVQERLAEWDYYGGRATGRFSRQTYEAVRLFQVRNGMIAHGIVDEATYAAMGIDPAAERPFADELAQDDDADDGAADADDAEEEPAEPAPAPAPAPGTLASRSATRSNDVRLLAQVVRSEAEAEPYLGKVAVAAVTLNRVRSSRFPNTLAGVVYQPGAYQVVRTGRINLTPRESDIRAAQDALNGWDPTYGALYFWNPAKRVHPWIWTRRITLRIGRHVFGV